MQHGYVGDMAGKITGMLIDLDRKTLSETLVTPEALANRIHEAKAMIEGSE